MEIRQKFLQESLMRSQEFQETLDDLLDTLSHLEETMDKQKPVSADLSKLNEQKEAHAQLHNDVMQLQPVFEQIVKGGNAIISEAMETTKMLSNDEQPTDIHQFETDFHQTIER